MRNEQRVDRVIERTDYVEAATDFNVPPRLKGDGVTLDIDPLRESFNDLRCAVVL